MAVIKKAAWIVVVTERETKKQFITNYYYDTKVSSKEALYDARKEFPRPQYEVFVGG